MKVVINKCYGGFSVSEAVYNELGIPWDGYGHLYSEELGYDKYEYDVVRIDKRLIAAIEKLGEEASSGGCAELKIVEVPDGVNWEITEYDGYESIREVSRIFG